MHSQPPPTEFEIIARYFSAIGPTADKKNSELNPSQSPNLGIGDDCALLSVAAGQQLALSIDTLVAGRHFPHNAPPYDIGQRALAVSISDLAAMGAKPTVFTLALTLPSVDEEWLQSFANGLSAAADHYGIALIGGDTTQGPLTLSLQVHGTVAASSALRRDGAKSGDAVFVTGSLGDGAAALALIEKRLTANIEQQQYLLSRYYQPEARVKLGQSLVGIANAAIDISDGLLADVGHIAKSSGLAVTIRSGCLPLSPVISAVCNAQQALDYALSGGDDYELCLTVAMEKRQQLLDCCQQLAVPITQIGEMTAGSGVQCVDASGALISVSQLGYQHFQS